MRQRQTLPTIVVILAMVSVACSGVPPSRVAYNSISDATVGIQSAVGVFSDLYKQGKVSEAAKVKLVAAHDIYRPAAKAVVDGCQAIAVDDKAGADVLIAKMQDAGQHVVELLVAVGVK